jgi:hypothetical protein
MKFYSKPPLQFLQKKSLSHSNRGTKCCLQGTGEELLNLGENSIKDTFIHEKEHECT